MDHLLTLDQKLIYFNKKDLDNLDKILLKFLEFKLEPYSDLYRIFYENLVNKNQYSLKKLPKLIQNFDQLVQYDQLRKKFSELAEPSLLLLDFWSKEFKTEDLKKIWNRYNTPSKKNTFLIHVILSNRVELVSQAIKNEYFKQGHFDKNSNYDENSNLLEHYTAIRGNFEIFMEVFKAKINLIPVG